MKDKSTATSTKRAMTLPKPDKTVMQTSHADDGERSRSHLWFYKTDHDCVEADNLEDVQTLLLFWSTGLKHNQR